MKKFLLILIIMLISITGCCKVNNESNTWNFIKGKEFSNYEIWTGSGMCFYEEDKNYYLDYKIYGSGVPIVYTYNSRVVIKNSNEIEVYLPNNIEMGSLDNNGKIVKVKLVYKDGIILFNNLLFKER